MNTIEHQPIFRKDYLPPVFLVSSTSLLFVLEEEHATVTSTVHYRSNPESQEKPASLHLSGEQLVLEKISLDGVALDETQYNVDEMSLTIESLPDDFILEITTTIYPDKNSSLEGLYRTNGNYCTQCEAEGFRKITYYPDTPCVLAPFTTRIEADCSANPVLLSNGNKIDEGTLDNNRHYAVWQDPHPKPSYLFALVAGDLVAIEDTFTTASGRKVALKIFVEARNRKKCGHAMTSLKKSMKWDEDVFGLEYDLDIFMIVAVDDFNMGAMENKGLNVFNSKYVLALPETATDRDYLGIEGVIGHEYFHNWTGNRVTCRDWFQLSLKEGLTVFRDQEFSSDLNSRAVQRIDDVNILRDYQFKEDASAMAHPVRPDSYVEINNFYTVTVYNKGAEVIRMMHTVLGKENFRAGMDLYFKRHDGQAVTCDDFVAAMADASKIDLAQFKNWYSQSGTPELTVNQDWDEKLNQYTLTVEQFCPSTPGQKDKKPFHMPLAIGLLGLDGKDLLSETQGTRILELKETKQSFVFDNITEKPALSFLRGFSSPVKVTPFQSKEDLIFLMQHDTDSFVRWDASLQLSCMIIFEVLDCLQKGETAVVDPGYITAFKALLSDKETDPALLALAITLPAERYLTLQLETIDVDNLFAARNLVRQEIADGCTTELLEVYRENNKQGSYTIDPEAMGRRALKNRVLGYLTCATENNQKWIDLCVEQYKTSENMTDSMAALAAVVETPSEMRDTLLADFYEKWQEDPLVLDKWFSIQATSSHEDALAHVKKLLSNPSFSMANPNKVRSLIGAFASGNHSRFHAKNGDGYVFLASCILALNSTNPQIAARLSTAFSNWKKYDSERQELMSEQLQRIAETPNLSKDVYEIVNKTRK